MPKRLYQMTILERADVKFAHFEELCKFREWRERFWKMIDYGILIISVLAAVSVLVGK